MNMVASTATTIPITSRAVSYNAQFLVCRIIPLGRDAAQLCQGLRKRGIVQLFEPLHFEFLKGPNALFIASPLALAEQTDIFVVLSSKRLGNRPRRVEPTELAVSSLKCDVSSFVPTAHTSHHTINKAMLPNGLKFLLSLIAAGEGKHNRSSSPQQPNSVVLAQEPVDGTVGSQHLDRALASLHLGNTCENLRNGFALNVRDDDRATRCQPAEMHMCRLAQHLGKRQHILGKPSHRHFGRTIGVDLESILLAAWLWFARHRQAQA